MSVQGPLHYRYRYGKAIFALMLFFPNSTNKHFHIGP